MNQPEQSPWPFPTGRERPIVETPPGWLMLPVLVGNDRSTPPIGIVRLQASRLPRTPDWCLSLAYTSPPVVRRDRPTLGAYQLEAFGLTRTAQTAPAVPDPELPPWLLPLEAAQRIGNEYRVRTGLVQAVAQAVRAVAAPGEPTPIDLCRELRAALGLPDGAMPCSPKEAWDEAIAKVRAQGQGAAS